MDALLPDWSLDQALVLRWPWREDIWPLQGRPAQQALVDLLAILTAHANHFPHRFIVQVPRVHLSQAQRALQAVAEHVTIATTDYADIWVRDSAPWYTRNAANGQLTAWCAGFNGWDGLDPDYPAEFTARRQLLQMSGIQQVQGLPWILEGGSLQHNGAGLGIYVKSSVLSAGRNPDLLAADFERGLQALGLKQIVAIEHGLACDETGGHADNICAFLNPQQLLVTRVEAPGHPEFDSSQAYYHALREKLQGHAIRLIDLPLPRLQLSALEARSLRGQRGRLRRHAGMPLCASYCNGIRLANTYLIPQFACDMDAEALRRVRQAAPELTVIPVPARALLAGGGGWHCASHLMPVVTVNEKSLAHAH